MYIAPYTSQQPVDDFGLTFPTLKFSATLAASTDTTFVVPDNAPAYKALIKCGFGSGGGPADVWVALNAVAAAPAGATFAATTSELLTAFIPLCRQVYPERVGVVDSQHIYRAGDVIHFYTTATGVDVSIVLYGLSTPN